MQRVGFFTSAAMRNRVHQLDRDMRRTLERVRTVCAERQCPPWVVRDMEGLAGRWQTYRDHLSTSTWDQYFGEPNERIAAFERGLIARRRRLSDMGVNWDTVPQVRPPAEGSEGLPTWVWVAGAAVVAGAATLGAVSYYGGRST